MTQIGEPDNFALQRTARCLRLRLSTLKGHRLRHRHRRAAAERGCYPASRHETIA
jgi:hypothetical protein